MTTLPTAAVALASLLDAAELAAAIEAGYVKVQHHPGLPLVIYNYTERCQWERAWTDVTLQCRGLIADDAGMVLARPWAKFFNYGEHPEGSIDLGAPAEVTDKLDGSLGILYPVPDGWAIATRGSFTSDQAIWATEWFRRYANLEFFNPRHTYLFEILIRWNRIVVHYDWEGLVLIGIVDTETGRDIDLPADPRLLQAWTPRHDREEHQGQLEGLEGLPGLPGGGAEAGRSEQPGTSAGVPQGLEPAQQGARLRIPQGELPEDPRRDRGGQAREAVPGLRADLSDVRDGLRSRARGQEVQHRTGEEPAATGRGDGQVRTGLRELPPDQDVQPFKITDRLAARSVAEALALEPRKNAEGVVVRMLDSGIRIKLKQEEYVALHRLVAGMNARVVWERISEGETARQICDGLPEEFWPWVLEVGRELVTEKSRIIDEAMAEHERIAASLPEGWARKDYALIASRSPLRAWLFMLLDKRDPSAKIWRTLRPSGERSLVAFSEDTA